MGWILILIFLLFLFTVSLCLYSVGRVGRERQGRTKERKKEGRMKGGYVDERGKRLGRKRGNMDLIGVVVVGQQQGTEGG